MLYQENVRSEVMLESDFLTLNKECLLDVILNLLKRYKRLQGVCESFIEIK